MKFSDGLFLEVARRVAAGYPDIAFDDRIIDALCMQLVQAPERFDVLVLPNMYGDIVAELCAGLIGGPGWRPAATSATTSRSSRPPTGPAPRLAGADRANPVGVILSARCCFATSGSATPATARGGGRRACWPTAWT